MLDSAIKAIGNNAGYIYITNDQLPNPWDTLPSYWAQEVSLIEYINSLLYLMRP